MDKEKILKIINYKNIGALDLLKFSLAFITFLFHWNVHFKIVYSFKIIDRFINAGAFCMTGFFILSGFLLYYIYSKKDFSDDLYLKQFYIKRLVKILPSYFALEIIFLIINLAKGAFKHPWVILGMQIIPIQAFFPDLFLVYLNGGFWFISVLLFLYFLFPLFCKLIKSIKSGYAIAGTFLFFYILSVFPTLVQCYYMNYNLGLYSMPVFRIAEFVIGMISAKVFLKYNALNKISLYLIPVILILIFLGVGGLYSSNYVNHIRFKDNYIYYNVITLILFPALIYCLSTAKSKVYTILTDNRFSNYLGKISYSFFLTQCLCIFIIKTYIKPHNYFGWNGLTILTISFAMNMFFSIIFYELFEKKFTKFLLNKLLKN